MEAPGLPESNRWVTCEIEVPDVPGFAEMLKEYDRRKMEVFHEFYQKGRKKIDAAMFEAKMGRLYKENREEYEREHRRWMPRRINSVIQAPRLGTDERGQFDIQLKDVTHTYSTSVRCMGKVYGRIRLLRTKNGIMYYGANANALRLVPIIGGKRIFYMMIKRIDI